MKGHVRSRISAFIASNGLLLILRDVKAMVETRGDKALLRVRCWEYLREPINMITQKSSGEEI